MTGPSIIAAARERRIAALATARRERAAIDAMVSARRLEALLGGAVVLAEEGDGTGGNPLARDALRPLLELIHRQARDLGDDLDAASGN